MKENKTVITSDAGMEYEFVYDYSIWSCDPKHPEFVGQEKLYQLMGQPLLNSAFEGYNTCLFAYGQVRLRTNHSYTVEREVCSLGPLIWRRVVPGKRVTCLSEQLWALLFTNCSKPFT